MKFTKDAVLKNLFEMAEADYAEFSGSLLGPEGKKETKMLGVRLPKLRKFAKEIVKADGMDYLNYYIEAGGTEALYMEEILLYGMVIGNMKTELENLFPYIERYVSLITNWSLCDSFCCSLKQTKKQSAEMWDFLQPYLRSEKEFEIRFGLVMLLNYYVQPEYIDRILQIVDSIHHEGYYVKMGAAWLLSACLVKEWGKSFAYMSSPDNHLDEFTYAKTVQKCRESYRLTKEQKEILAKLREKREEKPEGCGGKKQ